MRRPVAMIGSFVVLVATLASCGGEDAGVTVTGTPAPPPLCEPPDAGRTTVMFDGLRREYEVHLPDDFDPGTPAPLILSLHGLGGDILRHDLATGLPEEAGARGYIVVTPQAAPLSVPANSPNEAVAARLRGVPFWNFLGSPDAVDDEPPLEGLTAADASTDDVAFLESVIDTLIDTGCVDATRVFATGMSNGAGMATTLGCELGDRITAIAPVAGINLTARCPGGWAVPVLTFHGNVDNTVGYDGNSLLGFALGNPSVPARVDAWVERDGCDPEPRVETRPEVVVSTWSGCRAETSVELWTLQGWGHSWPRATDPSGPGAVDATELIVDFFDSVA